MRKIRRTGSGQGSRNRIARTCRRLAFSVLLPLISSCASKAQALPRKTPVLSLGKSKSSRTRPAKRDFASCRMNGRVLEYTLTDGTQKTFPDLLKKGERVLGTRCNDRFASVLTNTSLITVPGKSEGTKSNGRISLSFLKSRKDMRHILKKGVVAWAQGLDRSYFLGPDCSIREIPIFIKEKTVPVYYLPCKARAAQMVFHSGFLFIAPLNKKMFVVKIKNDAMYVNIKLPANIPGAEFFFKKRRLYFGKKNGQKIEIKIKGKKPSSVKLILK